VSTDCHSGPAEILENGRYGKLVPVGDASALSGGLLQALDESVGKNALYDRAKEFSPEEVVPQYMSILLNIASN
jgi:glycosyltransferase involved in cell wall biosynthesis